MKDLYQISFSIQVNLFIVKSLKDYFGQNVKPPVVPFPVLKVFEDGYHMMGNC